MDRQDIDALLIGALYGELTPADEARLSVHLDSHPTDRGALDDLKSARQAVRESRIFELQLDPPQAVSALLLQEAHRRAPKRAVVREEKESWFYRFTRVFMAHPAMAAAAMLVLVVGVASMLYVKKGEDTFADQEVSAPTAQYEVAADPALVPNTTTEAPADQGGRGVTEGAPGSGFAVGLHDKEDEQLDDQAKASAATRDRSVDKLKEQKDSLERQDAFGRQEAKKKPSGSVVVDTPRPQPKELPSRAKAGAKSDSDSAFDFKSADGVVGGATGTGTFSAAPGGGGGASGRAAGPAAGAAAPSTPRTATAPPPPAAPPASVAQAPAKPTTSATAKQTVTKEAEQKVEAKPADTAPAKDSTLIAWAKGEHNRTRSLVAKGDCITAAKVAVNISNRAPDYFSQNVATDIALKKCQRYIAEARDAEAERSGKARSQKRVNANEPAADSAK